MEAYTRLRLWWRVAALSERLGDVIWRVFGECVPRTLIANPLSSKTPESKADRIHHTSYPVIRWRETFSTYKELAGWTNDVWFTSENRNRNSMYATVVLWPPKGIDNIDRLWNHHWIDKLYSHLYIVVSKDAQTFSKFSLCILKANL